jgi:hypothetical protein
MNKTAIKNFAIWARNKLIADITYKAGLLGITDKKIKEPLPSSTKDVLFFDIGTMEPFAVMGIEIEQRKKLAEIIEQKAKQSDYVTAYKSVVEEVAYTWFNRLIAVRFMEVNDYLPSRIRVLSSESETKIEPDIVTAPFDTELDFTPYEKDRIVQLKNDNKLDVLLRMLFIKQCNALNEILPELFEKTSDYTELLLNINFTDKDGVVYRLVHDILEDDFNVYKEGQVEIIGWLYQYYNTEPKANVDEYVKKGIKVIKQDLPAKTQLFTPDWIVRYMVENSLGRLWLEGHPNEAMKAEWKYYLDEAEQEADVQKKLDAIREEYKTIKLEDIKVIDPCMGSGHILVYAFDVLIQIYESCGYSQPDAAKSILEHNIYGLDIDNRAYQLAFFAVMMKARQYNRRILDGKTICHVYAIQESNSVNRDQLKFFGTGMEKIESNTAMLQIQGLLDTFIDAKEYGSVLNVDNYNWDLLRTFTDSLDTNGQMKFDAIGIENTKGQLHFLIEIGAVMAQKYDVVVTNPPYMGNGVMDSKLSEYVKKHYTNSKTDMFACCIEMGFNIAKSAGFISMITMESWMFLSSFEQMRQDILRKKTIVNMVHMPYLGKGGTSLGINFGTAAVIIKNCYINNYSAQYDYICYYETDEEGVPFNFPTINERYKAVSSKNFSKIPGMPIAYWVSDKILKIFEKPMIESYVLFRQGMATSDNNRFLKLWHEVSLDKCNFKAVDLISAKNSLKKWFAYNKGGAFRKWYGNTEYVVNWENDGAEMKAFTANLSQGMNVRLKSREYYFKECYSWSKVTSAQISFRYYPVGFAFDVAGCCVFESGKNQYYFFALSNSKITSTIAAFLSPTLNFELDHLKKIPIIINNIFIDKVENLTRINIQISKLDWDSFETSWDFQKHPLIAYRSMSAWEGELFSGRIEQAYNNWSRFVEHQFTTLKSNEEELNRIFIDIYGLQYELTPEVKDKDVTVARIYETKEDIPESMKGNNYVLTKGDVIKSFISYAMGCMFGRYSLDVDELAYAGGQWYDSKYSTLTPDKDNVLPITDEEYFEDDIVGLFVAFVKKVYGAETLEENLDFIADALGNKGDTSREVIRNYFLRDFFKDHCKTYQKRPIYWLFDSGKADGFKALIYMHRYDENTIGNLRIDYLHRMQRVYESEIARMQETINNSTNAREATAAEKRKEKLIKQLKETKDYDEKIAHLALARIAIDLDDGVKVNYEKVQTGTDGKKLDVLAGI